MKIVALLRRRPLLVFALFAVAAAACVPIRMEARWPSVTLIDDNAHILLTYNDRVVMLDTEDGEEPTRLRNADGEVRVDDEGNPRRWEFSGPQQAPNHFFSTPVLLDADTLVIPTYNSRIYEVDLPTARANVAEGTELAGQVVANSTLWNDLLYVGMERRMVALEPGTWQERWEFITDQSVWAKPLIHNDILYFTSLDHFLYALDPETGDEIWSLDLNGAAAEAPVLYEDNLYVGTFARQVLKVSLDGEVLAEYDTEDWVWGAPSIVNNILYVADLSGMVYALNLTGDGFEERWRIQAGERAINMTPLVTGEYVIVGSRDHKLYWLNRSNGSIFFERELPGEVLSNLVLVEADESLGVDESLVLAGTPDNAALLSAFTVQNGTLVWTYSR